MSHINHNRSKAAQQDLNETRKWHAISTEKVMSILKTDDSGINESELEKRRAVYGYNEMTGKKKDGVLKSIFHQIHSFLVLFPFCFFPP